MTNSTISVSFTKGQQAHLDEVIAFIGILPIDSYHQDDPHDWEITSENTSGELVTFLKDIDINIKINIK